MAITAAEMAVTMAAVHAAANFIAAKQVLRDLFLLIFKKLSYIIKKMQGAIKWIMKHTKT